MFQIARRRARSALVAAGERHAAKDKHQDLDFIIGQLDWEKNVDTHFKEHNYLEPIVDKSRSGNGYTDSWIVYGTVDGEQLFSAKELTRRARREVHAERSRRQRLDHRARRGRIGKLEPANAGDDPLRRRRPKTKCSSRTKPPRAASKSKTPAASRWLACATSAPTCIRTCRRWAIIANDRPRAVFQRLFAFVEIPLHFSDSLTCQRIRSQTSQRHVARPRRQRARHRSSADQPGPDARTDGRGQVERPEVRRRRSVSVPSAHRSGCQRRRNSRDGRQDRRRRAWRSARSWRRSGPARSAVRRWATTRTARTSSLAVEKACRIAKMLNKHGVRKYGVIRIDSADSPDALGRRPQRQHAKRSPTRSAKRPRSPRKRRAARRRRRNLLGRHALLAATCSTCSNGRHARDGRLPGRHGPHLSLPARLQRRRSTRC